MDVLGISKQTVLDPRDYHERVLTDAVYMNIFLILEEANGLDFETKLEYPEFP